MAENVNGSDLFGSGGHTWSWGSPRVTEKVLGTAGTTGEAGIRTNVGSAPVRIAGVLKAANNAALTTIEAAIEQLKADRTVCAWEDDQGNSGSALVIVDYARQGSRLYAADGAQVWQRYACLAEERHGGPFIS